MNRCIPRNFRSPLVLACAVAGIWVISPPLPGEEMQVGRYSVARTLPTPAQADLLAAIVTIRFPQHVRTVGEAVRHLLRDSGYRLADPHTASPGAMLGLPLPGAHRSLGPLTLRQALETLAGPVFRLVQDPVHRLLAFELCTPPGRTVRQAGSGPVAQGLSDGE